MNVFKKLVYYILLPYKKFKDHKEFKKRLEELRKRDPFIYK
jgi:hypothetical protein